LGRAVWLFTRGEHSIDTAPIEGLSTPTRDFSLSLAPGWNAIGNPFAFPVAWADVISREPIEPPVAFDPSIGANGDYAALPVEVLSH
jgi:hypothetical protein